MNKYFALMVCLLFSSFSFAQTFYADMNSKLLGNAFLAVDLQAAQNVSTNLVTENRFEKIDQGVEGDFLCKNTLNFVNAAQARVSFRSADETMYAETKVPVTLQVQDVVRYDNVTDCTAKVLTGMQKATLLGHAIHSQILLKDDGKTKLVLRVSYFYMSQGLNVEVTQANDSYKLTTVNYADLAPSSGYAVTYGLVEESTDANGRVKHSFLENGTAKIRH